MRIWGRIGIILALAATALSQAQDVGRDAAQWRERSFYALVNIDCVGPERLAALKATPGLAWWVEVEDRLLVLANREALRSLAVERDLAVLRVPPRPHRLAFAGLPLSDALGDCQVLVEGGRFAVVQLEGDGEPALPLSGRSPDPHGAGAGHHCSGPVWAFQPNRVLTRQYENGPRPALKRATVIENMLAEIDAVRWFGDMFELSCIDRYTRGMEIADARDWLVGQFSSIPGLTVTTQAFDVGPDMGENVIATMTGTERPEDLVIVGAHYDSIAESASVRAPGAEDNGSGVAALLEMARIFSRYPPKATLVFIAYSGEEQGLYGSVDHATRLEDSGAADNVEGVLIMDMIGYTRDLVLDCLLETNSSGQFLIDLLAASAKTYTKLTILTSLDPFGSDHIPYLNRDMPAVLTIENDWSNYPGYHRSTDEIDRLGLEMGVEVIKMNLAALAQLAGVEGLPDLLNP